jgi:hypothetical protein
LASRLIYPVNIRTPVAETKSSAHYLQNTVYTFVDHKNFVKKRIAPCEFCGPYSIIYLYIQSMGESRRRFINHPKSFFAHTPAYMDISVHGYYVRGTRYGRHINYSITYYLPRYHRMIISHRYDYYVRQKYPPHTGQVLTTFIINCM